MVNRPDQKAYVYTYTNGKWVTDANVSERLVRLANASNVTTGWEITALDGTVEHYDPSGTLLFYRHPSGLTQTFTQLTSTRTSIADQYGRTLILDYGSDNNLAALTDPSGNVTRYGYDANGNLISVTYPDGAVRQYHYENNAFKNLLTGITDENGNRFITYSYDSQGRAVGEVLAGNVGSNQLSFGAGSTTVTDALGTQRTYGFQTILGVAESTGVSQPGGSGCGPSGSSLTYDINGNVATRTDFNGNKSCYAYDLTRNLETVRLEGVAPGSACPADLAAYVPPAGSTERKTTTTWNATYRLPLQIAEPLRITSYSYDAKGNLLTRTLQPTSDATGGAGQSAAANGTARTTTYTYDTYGQVLTADGPRTDVTDVTAYAYDPQGNLTSVTNALNQTTTLGNYDANGRAGSLTDPNGLVTSLKYDLRGRLLTRTAGGETTSYTYDGVGQLITVTTPTGAAYTYTYDAAHRLTGIADGSGNRISYTLDAAGNRTKEEIFDSTGNLAQTRSRVFDALNRLWKDIGAVNQTTVFEYDANGNLTTITDPLNRQSTHKYDALNRLVTSTDAASGVTRYGYDGLDQLVSVTDPRNLSTQYQRDGLGNLNQQTSPDTGNTGYTFDAAGNVLTRTDAKGQLASYTYDALNRLTAITYTGGTSPAQTVTYQYDQGTDGIGHLTQIVDSTGTTGYSYDQHGRLTAETRQPGTGTTTYTTAYGYDTQGRLNSITYPSGRVVSYSFDGMGRISQIATTFDGTTKILASNIAYEPFGGVHSFSYGDGTTAPLQTYVRQRDQDGRIASYTLGGRAMSLGYDAASQISFIADPQNLADTANYGYDQLSRLTSYTQSAISQGYGYDANGNRTTQTLGSTLSNYSYAADSNRLNSIQTGATTQTVTQDANGSTTADATRQYGYDLRGRLIRATTAQGVINYEVNALGLRVRKQVPYANTDTLYHYDAQGHLIAENENGKTRYTREYIYLNDQPVAVMQ
jgi:YD repeat-containing protein